MVASRPGRQRPALLIGALILIFFVGFRYKVGCDWTEYLAIFRSLRFNFGAALAKTDPAYGITNWAAANMSLGIWAVNLVCAAVFAIGLVSLCRMQPNPPLAMAVAVPYLVIVVTSYTREGAAIGMVMLATAQYSRGAFVKMAFSLLVAAAFHKSAIVVIPFFGLALSRQRFLSLFMFLLLGAAVYYVFVSRSISLLYQNYIETRYASSGATVRILMDVIPALFFLGFRNRFGFSMNDRRLWELFSIAAVAAMAAVLLSPSSTAVDRTALYLIPLQLVVLSRLPSAFGSKERQNLPVTTVVILYSLGVELIWLNYGLFAKCWIPYQNYLWL